MSKPIVPNGRKAANGAIKCKVRNAITHTNFTAGFFGGCLRRKFHARIVGLGISFHPGVVNQSSYRTKKYVDVMVLLLFVVLAALKAFNGSRKMDGKVNVGEEHYDPIAFATLAEHNYIEDNTY